MARKRSDLEQIRRAAYFLQRDIGDAQAARRGNGALEKRLARRYLTRAFFRMLRNFGR